MSIRIEVNNDQKEFEPGQTLSGKVIWDVDKDPQCVSLNLFWSTDGKGSEDVEVVDSLDIDSFSRSGEKDFQFELPSEPYSFSGKLISICWALEAFVKKGSDKDSYELIIGPGGKEVQV